MIPLKDLNESRGSLIDAEETFRETEEEGTKRRGARRIGVEPTRTVASREKSVNSFGCTRKEYQPCNYAKVARGLESIRLDYLGDGLTPRIERKRG